MPNEETDSDCSMEGIGETAASRDIAEHIYQQERNYESQIISQKSKHRTGL